MQSRKKKLNLTIPPALKIISIWRINVCISYFFPFLRIKNKPEQTFGFAFVPVKIENVYGIVLQERNLHQSSVDYVQ